MGSQLKVDTITGVTTAGSVAVTGEGNSTTTNLQLGLSKAWINFDGTGTAAIRDSANIASITDNGTGLYSITFTNAMNNDDYSRTGAVGEDGSSGGNRIHGLRLRYTGYYNICLYNTSAGLNDCGDICSTAHGDLA